MIISNAVCEIKYSRKDFHFFMWFVCKRYLLLKFTIWLLYNKVIKNNVYKINLWGWKYEVYVE